MREAALAGAECCFSDEGADHQDVCRTLRPLDMGTTRVVGLGFGPLGFRVWESAGLLQEFAKVM